MRYRFDNQKLILMPQGRIDSQNAQTVAAEIEEVKNANEYDSLQMDMEQVEYLSSVGLRLLLKLKKEDDTFSLINVNFDVYNVLETTGFTEILNVRKAYRNLSVEGCEKIGEGSNGVVYRYTDDIIVKVYKNKGALEDIHKEREMARTALVMGINTAIPYDVVKVGDNYGSVFELLNNKSISKLILADPENQNKYIKILSDFLKEIHDTEVVKLTLPSAKEKYLEYVEYLKDYLEPEYYKKLHDLVEAVPESNHMIHGDYHSNNVHYANGEAILIDMDTLSVGNPIFELASFYNAYKGFNEMDDNSSYGFMKLDAALCDAIYDEFMKDYFDTDDPSALQTHENAMRLLAYTRLLRRTIRRHPDRTKQIEHLKQQLISLIAEVKELAI